MSLSFLRLYLYDQKYDRHGSHLANLCRNLFTLRWKSVIEGLCLVRPQVFRFGKNFANRQNSKYAVVLEWGRQIFAKSSQTMGITAVTVNACQCNMKNDTRGKFSSSSRFKIRLRAVPTIVIAHTFCASPDTRISYHRCLVIQGYFCAV